MIRIPILLPLLLSLTINISAVFAANIAVEAKYDLSLAPCDQILRSGVIISDYRLQSNPSPILYAVEQTHSSRTVLKREQASDIWGRGDYFCDLYTWGQASTTLEIYSYSSGRLSPPVTYYYKLSCTDSWFLSPPDQILFLDARDGSTYYGCER